jgi:hypothetical protein
VAAKKPGFRVRKSQYMSKFDVWIEYGLLLWNVCLRFAGSKKLSNDLAVTEKRVNIINNSVCSSWTKSRFLTLIINTRTDERKFLKLRNLKPHSILLRPITPESA